jgi:hypothetical protein
MPCKSAVAVMVTAILLAAGAARADDWLIYQNDRYGTTVDYPDFFKMQPPPDADDGREFKSADGADFKVYASYNALDFTVATYRDFIVKNLDPGSVITYETRGKDWFVVSGTRGDRIFYERHLLSYGGQMNEDLVITYPASAKQNYDPVVARMTKSLRSGKGFQSP